MGIISKDFVRSEWILPFENLAVNGKIRSDMTEPGHHDGWGMVSYFRKDFPGYIERRPHSVTKDTEYFRKGTQRLQESRSKTALIHFRKISVGEPVISNTHPFLCQQWAFAHNGTIFDGERIPLRNLKPSGTTDSERFFLYLIEQIAQTNQESKNHTTVLKEAIEKIKKNFKHTSLTFLLTDGNSIYAYRECDPQYEDYYTLCTTQIAAATLFCSEPMPLADAKWIPLGNDQLTVAILI